MILNAAMIVNALIVVLLGITTAQAQQDRFRGAVVEYGAKYNQMSSKTTVTTNVQSYSNIVDSLKKQYNDLKIVVFPEFGLTSPEWIAADKTQIYSEHIPEKNPSDLLCQSTSTVPEVLRSLSCLAQRNAIYLVVNVVEKSSKNNIEVLYNTNIVFSPRGALISKYRKYNLFGKEKKLFEKPERPQVEYFETDFGVKFGSFIGSDILFKSPAQDLVSGSNAVSHVVYPAAWESQLPYLTAVQEQSGWSYGTNKVLLASGLNNPKSGSSGTGIYYGKLGAGSDTTFDKRSLQNQIKGDFAIVSNVPKDLNTIKEFSSASEIYYFHDVSQSEKIPLKIERDNLDVYTTETFNEQDKFEPVSGSDSLKVYSKTFVNRTVCNNEFCCDFLFSITKGYCLDLTMPSTSDTVGEEFGQYKYRLAVFNGVKNYDGTQTGGVQVCSIISCSNDSADSCGTRTESNTPAMIKYSDYRYLQCYTQFDDVTIKARLTTDNSFVTSNILLSSDHYALSKQGSKKNNFIKFGKVADPSLYTVSKNGDTENQTTPYVLTSTGSIVDPASINLYNRLYSSDGKPETKNENHENRGSNGTHFQLSGILLVISFAFSLLRIH